MLDSRLNIKEIHNYDLYGFAIQESDSRHIDYLTFSNARYHLGLGGFGHARTSELPYPNSVKFLANVLVKGLSDDEVFALLKEINYWCFWNAHKDCGFYHWYNKIEFHYLYDKRLYRVMDVVTFKHEEDLMAFKLRFGF